MGTGMKLLACVLMLGVVACGGDQEAADPPAGDTVTATTEPETTITVRGELRSSQHCRTLGHSGGTRRDGPVVITDSQGTLLAEGRIRSAEPTEIGQRCIVEWMVDGVPEGAAGYRIRVGDQPPVDLDWVQLTDGDGVILSD